MKKIFSFLFVVAMVITSCSEDTENPSTTGRLKVQITDAPFPFDLVAEANTTITKIEARKKDNDTGGSPFVILTEQEATINLVELTNGLTETLADVEVPVGTYDLLRVYIKEASVVLTDGTTYDMTVPSGAQSGLKIFIKPSITIGGGSTENLLLDFDISRSFVPRSNPNAPNGITGFNFKPVIKACNLRTSGTLSGTVTGVIEGESPMPLEGAQISIFAADTLNTTTFTNADGHYTVLGLTPGSYDISAEADGYTAETAEEVLIETGETVQDFELVGEGES